MSDFKTIKFSNNWNRKLDNNIFTTIRKIEHYVLNGDRVAIVLNDKLYKWAIVTAMIECEFRELGVVLLMCDTGYEIEETLNIFKNMGIMPHPGTDKIKVFVLKTIPKPGWIQKEILKETQQQQIKIDI